ncbi:MAG: hypothetical protein Q8S44_05305 [Flavobacteriaceae bacterium]|nr:hypothetical protein [Flavobacteriaceae bacterium]
MDKKDLNPDAIYDITGIKSKEMWEFYFTRVFPEHVFTACWVGRRKNIEGILSSREESRLLFMRLTEERFRTFRLYWDAFTFHFQDGKIEMFMGGSISSETRAKLEQQHLEGKDWLEAVYGHPVGDGEVAVTFLPRTFEELNLVTAMEFTEDEKKAITNAEIQKQIDQKMKETEELKAKMI